MASARATKPSRGGEPASVAAASLENRAIAGRAVAGTTVFAGVHRGFSPPGGVRATLIARRMRR